MAAIAANQVTIIAGETGSGKTTQIPKMCLELGLGENGLIGHTQPRRLAARTVAERIAEELGVEIGQEVGFQVRFTGEVSRNTKVKLMTDGILLAEIQRDKLLRKYNAIIIDEAHERSLNIDFILGYLKRILPQRPDLKIIITSATIDPQRFAKHFGSEEEPSPIIEVSGRTYPVEIRYRPLSQPAGGAAGDDDVARLRRRTRGGPRSAGRRVRRRRRTRAGSPRRHPDLLLRRTRDPRRRRGPQRQDPDQPAAGRHRGAPALRPAEPAGTAQGLPPRQQAPDRPGHQRRRDLADGPRHQVRHRHRHRPHLALLAPHQGPAPADRARLAGLGQPALRPLRPRLRRHRHPAVLGGGLRVPAAVHRSGDPAHQPRRRHPADDRHGRGPRAEGRGELPVRGAAGLPRHQRRRHPPARARRPERRPAAGRNGRRRRTRRPPAGRRAAETAAG